MTAIFDLCHHWTLTGATLAEGSPAEFATHAFPATVPGCLHTALLAAGAIPDPYADATSAPLDPVSLRQPTVLQCANRNGR